MGALVLATASPASAAQAPVDLGTAGGFAVLAGSGITNTGPTTITGDVGTFPTTSQTGFQTVTLNGANHGGDAVTQGAKSDLVTAYNDAAGRRPVNNVAVELGGSRLLAGVYGSGTFGLTGTLTLDAEGNPDAVFIFQAGSTLTTATDSQVLLVNGADPCHVHWQIGSSATFGARTSFVGDVLVLTSISAGTGATFKGRLLARDGAVTLDSNTVTRAGCVSATSTGGSTTVTPSASTTDGTTTSSGAAAPTSPDAALAAASPTTTVAARAATPVTTRPPSRVVVRSPTPTTSGSPPLATTGSATGGLIPLGGTLVLVGVVVATAARPRRRHFLHSR